jgi:hypothetical protein
MERLRNLAAPLPLVLILVFVVAAAARGESVLDQVPRDALGFAIIRNLSDTDAQVSKSLTALGSRFPGPLALLKSIAGLDAGLDLDRDLLVVLLPPQNNSEQFHLALWLPASDYDALVRSLDGDPQRRVAAVTLAGEDLLAVRDGDWAVVMDVDQRDRLEQFNDNKSAPPQQLNLWSEWIATNDVAVVVLPGGMRAAWAYAAKEGLFDPTKVTPPPVVVEDDLFGPAGRRSAAASSWQSIRHSIQTVFAEAPELARLIDEAEGAACGLRFDDEGNTLAGVRLALSPEFAQHTESDTEPAAAGFAPMLYRGGPFVVASDGLVSPRWAVPAVAPYARQASNDLVAHFGSKLADADLAQFRQQAERAVAEVSAYSLLTRPGADADGVFTNNFLALRVASSPKFLEMAAQLVESWNAMVKRTETAKALALDAQPVTISGHKGTEYSIDMSKAVDVPVLPDIKASMERLFGPGGKFRLQFIEIDPQTVILAAATEEQVAKVIAAIQPATTPEKISEELREPARLLDADTQWRVFFSPHGYSELLARQMDAILGAVIGGPVVPQFPVSPPVGFGGGVDAQVLWAEVAVPVETLRGYSKYSRQ